MISFVIPAHNEEALLASTLRAIHDSARSIGRPYEVIVVNDASTDHTAEIARQNNARLIDVNHRQIAATRNSGARAAQGDRFFFIDADTTINSRVLASALRHMDKGAAGGGALCRFEGDVPHYARLLIWWLGLFMRLLSLSGGAFMFCTRQAFLATGGFDERLFGAEDAAMSWALKREGRFVLLWQTVLTSGRRVRGPQGFRAFAALIQMAFFPKMLRKRSGVKKIWYESNREMDQRAANSLAIKIFNIIALVFTILMISGPLWIIPWPRSLLDGPLGTVKFASGVIGAIMAWGNTKELIRFWWPAAFQRIYVD